MTERIHDIFAMALKLVPVQPVQYDVKDALANVEESLREHGY
jgi:hypothetical protein